MLFAVLPPYEWNNHNNISFQQDEVRYDNYDFYDDYYNNNTISSNNSLYDNITNNTNQINENRRYNKPNNEYAIRMILILSIIFSPLICFILYKCCKISNECCKFICLKKPVMTYIYTDSSDDETDYY